MDDLISPLLALTASVQDQISAIKRIQACITAKDEGWKHQQANPAHNLSVAVYECLSRCMLRLKLQPTVDVPNIARLIKHALLLLQGLLLLHRQSTQLNARRCNIELLLALLSVEEQYINSDPLTPPVTTESELKPSVAQLALDTILCGLADLPANMRKFEEANGIHAIMRILKSSHVAKPVREKCIEFLYFYIQPEDRDATLHTGQVQPLKIQQILEICERDWVPQTPRRERKAQAVTLSASPSIPSLSVASARSSLSASQLEMPSNPFVLPSVSTPLRSSTKHDRTRSQATSPNISSPMKKRPTALPLGLSTNLKAFEGVAENASSEVSESSVSSSGRSRSIQSLHTIQASPRKRQSRPIAATPRRQSNLNHHHSQSATPINHLTRSTSEDSPLFGLSDRATAILSPQFSASRSRSSRRLSKYVTPSNATSQVDGPREGIRSVENKKKIIDGYAGNADDLFAIFGQAR